MDSGSGGSTMDAAPAATCAAASLAPMPDAGLLACFQCHMAMCAAELTACSTDCTCAPAYQCLEANSNINGLCPSVMAALANSDDALTRLSSCSVMKCNSPCFGDGG
jgi:hypothetical protein